MPQMNSSVTITCSSDLAVQTIRWLNNSDNRQELISNSGQQPLFLPIENVTLNLNNTMYTCEVQVMLATGVETIQEMITIQFNGSHYLSFSVLINSTDSGVETIQENIDITIQFNGIKIILSLSQFSVFVYCSTDNTPCNGINQFSGTSYSTPTMLSSTDG